MKMTNSIEQKVREQVDAMWKGSERARGWLRGFTMVDPGSDLSQRIMAEVEHYAQAKTNEAAASKPQTHSNASEISKEGTSPKTLRKRKLSKPLTASRKKRKRG